VIWYRACDRLIAASKAKPALGELVVYKSMSGTTRTVRVTKLYSEGGLHPMFTGTDESGNQYWGYVSQIFPRQRAIEWIFRSAEEEE